mmetsp:Transcript_18034/g.30731  ORF Transcript_18034/g.30731 Transcript_18034/m.30731 type:complete len:159 (+) Transcript_18034:232-708(+)
MFLSDLVDSRKKSYADIEGQLQKRGLKHIYEHPYPYYPSKFELEKETEEIRSRHLIDDNLTCKGSTLLGSPTKTHVNPPYFGLAATAHPSENEQAAAYQPILPQMNGHCNPYLPQAHPLSQPHPAYALVVKDIQLKEPPQRIFADAISKETDRVSELQ